MIYIIITGWLAEKRRWLFAPHFFLQEVYCLLTNLGKFRIILTLYFLVSYLLSFGIRLLLGDFFERFLQLEVSIIDLSSNWVCLIIISPR